MKSFNGWLVSRISNFLRSQACTVETTYYTVDGCKTVIEDDKGNRYEILVKQLAPKTPKPFRAGMPDSWSMGDGGIDYV